MKSVGRVSKAAVTLAIVIETILMSVSAAPRAWALAKARPTVSGRMALLSAPGQKDGILRSGIRFDRDKPIVEFADVSRSDPMGSCPIESFPGDLKNAVDQMVAKVLDSVKKVKDSSNTACGSLATRLDDSRKQFQDVLSSELVNNAKTLPTSEADLAKAAEQARINDATRQAQAINQLLLTTGDIIQGGCVTEISDKIAIQRLVGQIITVGGLIAGGWPGIMTAAGGQLIGRLPIFKSEIDSAIQAFKKYEETTSRGAFLCLYRQMQKTSCMLFADRDAQMIGGVDLTFRTGPAKVTRDSLSRYGSLDGTLSEDAAYLFSIAKSMPKIGDLATLTAFCRADAEKPAFLDETLHPPSVVEAFRGIRTDCERLNRFEYPTLEEEKEMLREVRRGLQILSAYYAAAKDSAKETDGRPNLGMIAATYESMKFFEGLKRSAEAFRDQESGNQMRLSYRALTEELGDGLARDSFRDMVRANRRILRSPDLKADPVHGDPVRERALKAMIDACQTFDPTLTCLYTGSPRADSLFKEWREHCVGPSATLCQQAEKLGRKILEDDPRYAAYLESVCPARLGADVDLGEVGRQIPIIGPIPGWIERL